MNAQQCHISGITRIDKCKEIKAKWRTCPVGGLAPVSPTAALARRVGNYTVH